MYKSINITIEEFKEEYPNIVALFKSEKSYHILINRVDIHVEEFNDSNVIGEFTYKELVEDYGIEEDDIKSVEEFIEEYADTCIIFEKVDEDLYFVYYEC